MSAGAVWGESVTVRTFCVIIQITVLSDGLFNLDSLHNFSHQFPHGSGGDIVVHNDACEPFCYKILHTSRSHLPYTKVSKLCLY